VRGWLGRDGLPPFGRIGLLLAAVAGLVAALSPFLGDLVSGTARFGGGPTSIALEGAGAISMVAIGLVTMGLLAGAAYATQLWAHLAGTAIATAAAAIYAVTVAAARANDELAADVGPTLEPSAIAIAIAYGLSVVGIVIALTSARYVVPLASTPESHASSGPRRSSAATTGLVLAILGVLVPFASALAVAVTSVALADVRASESRTGRGTSLAGLVLGALMLTLWATLSLRGILTAEPSD